MKHLFVAVGSVGDVYPYLGIGHRLRQRGHDVALIASPYYEKQVRDLDLELIPLGTVEDQLEMIHHPLAWHRNKGWRVWVEYGAVRPLRSIYRLILKHYVPHETVVTASWGGLAARLAQETHGISLASLHLMPDVFRSRHKDALAIGPRWAKELQFHIADRWVIDPLLQPVTEFREELGLPRMRRYLDSWWHSPQLVLGLFPEWWAAPQPDWPQNTVLTGYPLWDNNLDGELPDDVEAFLSQGEAPVVFAPGVIRPQAKHFFEIAAKVCERQGLRAIFVTQHPDILPERLPSGVRHFHYVPFGPLFRRARAVVHHAGTGTTWQCLAAGVPQLVIPPMHLHRDTARRLWRHRLGHVLLPLLFGERSLRIELGKVLNDAELPGRCRAIAARLTEDATDPICDRLETLVGAEQPVVLPHRRANLARGQIGPATTS